MIGGRGSEVACPLIWTAQTNTPGAPIKFVFDIASFYLKSPATRTTSARKLRTVFASSDWQPFANHSVDLTDTSNKSKIVLAHSRPLKV